MAANNDNAERHVVPRWRSFRDAVATRELDPVSIRDREGVTGLPFIAEKEAAWRENQALPFAIDLVSAATVLGPTPTAERAAHFILERQSDISPVIEELAMKLLGIAPSAPAGLAPLNRIQLIGSVRQFKARRVSQARNAFVWGDLARLYASLGQLDSAHQAMRVALALAPTERFVLRCAARLLLHSRRTQEALDLLRKNPRTPYDPWLIAAEVSISDIAGKSPRFGRVGLQLLSQGSITSFHSSELTSALATLEMHAGKHKHARRLFTASLEEPTDNCLAQAVWACRQTGIQEINNKLFLIPRASEAITLDLFNRRRWAETVAEANTWSNDERFSARPSQLSSAIAASLLGQPRLAAEVARRGLDTNRRHPGLVNNLAFALILDGQPAEALGTLETANRETMSPTNAICLLATTGLAYYRLGKSREGGERYESAIKTAEQRGQHGLKVLATLYYSRERVRLGDPGAGSLFEDAFEAARKLPHTSIPAVAELLANDIAASTISPTATVSAPRKGAPRISDGNR